MTLWNSNRFLKISFFIILNRFITASTEIRFTTIAVVEDPIVFEDYDSTPPANLKLTQDFDQFKSAEVSAIYVTVTNVTENFSISLLVNPYVKNKADCHRLDTTGNDVNNLRLYQWNYPMLANSSENTSRSFSSIITGCYHFVMTNSEMKHWQYPPVFYNGTVRYLDTLLRPGKFKFKPENTNSSMVLRALIKVPLDCIDVRTRFWELDKNVKNAMADIERDTIGPQLECTVSIKDEKMLSNCSGTAASITNRTLKARLVEKDENGWTGILEWSNLTRGGAQYHVYFYASTMKKCFSVSGWYNTQEWDLIQPNIFVELGYASLNNAPSLTPGTYEFPWFPTACGLISGIIVVVLTYWIKKYWNLYLLPGYGNEDECHITKEPIIPLNEKESDQILLMYESGSDLFMKKMEDLRNDLEQQCSGFNIHDVYAINEWNRVRQLGAPGWVQELLKSGSKIIWVDTPQFRSRLNDKQRRYTKDDFRDDAVPYAVSVVTDSLLNSSTQYQRHFVVRMNGVEVQDGYDDPLQVVSPHARYYLPEQFDYLCNDLKGPMRLMNKKAVN